MKSAHGHESRQPRSPYVGLAWMAVLSFAAMYVLMYVMVDRVNNVYSNLDQFYMAGLMAMPMVIIELVVLRSMYASRGQFLKSMIPHHAGAILMCERTEMTDP